MDQEEINILIILGMHRSGTSLLTHWLSTCGLVVGDHLLGERPSNLNGHFEDIDFVRFHDDILEENNMSVFSGLDKKRVISPYFNQRAKALIHFKSELYPQWGWKDPRTCLFLSLWSNLVPTATYVVIFRYYQQVVDSLLKRDFQRLKEKYKHGFLNRLRLFIHQQRLKNKIPSLANQYLASWCHYNQCLINFLEKNKEILVLNVENIKKTDENIVNYLLNNGFELNYTPMASLFNPKYWNTAKKYSFNYSLDKELIQRADKIFSTLDNYKQFTVNTSDET